MYPVFYITNSQLLDRNENKNYIGDENYGDLNSNVDCTKVDNVKFKKK